MCSRSKLAILFFSRNSRFECEQKRWFAGSGRGRNQAIATALIAHSLKAVQASGLPVYRYHEGNQRGNTFGERLANAYEDLFNLGYSGVIAVGNDTPQLSAIDWQEATSPLKAGHCVLGASLRGGAYIIGITAASFNKDIFQNLPWQTSSLFQGLESFCARSGNQPCLLPALRDINTFHDLLALIRVKGIDRGFNRFISRALTPGKLLDSFFCTDPRSSFAPLLCLRGPPAVC